MIYEPERYQKDFHQSGAKYRWCKVPAGGGKSLTCAMEVLQCALEYPGITIAVCRKYKHQLLASTWKMLVAILRETFGKYVKEIVIDGHNTQNRLDLILFNGSEIIGIPLSDPSRIQGINIGAFWIDEPGELDTIEAFNEIDRRMRLPNIGPLRGWMSGVPNFYDWMYELFVEQQSPRFVLFEDMLENLSWVDQTEVKEKRKRYTPQEAAQYLDASFSTGAGKVFKIDREKHICEAEEIPQYLSYYRGIDPGINDECACVWVGIDQHGHKWIDRVLYQSDLPIPVAANKIIEMTGNDKIESTWIDAYHAGARQAWDAETTIQDMYEDCGIYPIYLSSRKKGSKRVAVEMIRDDLYYGRLHISSNCEALIREMERWRTLPNGDYEDKNDHLISALRFVYIQDLEEAPMPRREHIDETFEQKQWRLIQEKFDTNNNGRKRSWEHTLLRTG